MAATRTYIVSDHSQTQSDSIYPTYFLPSALISWEMLFYTYFAHDTITARCMLLLDVGGYHIDQLHAEDYDLWYRLSKASRLAILPDIETCLFINSEGISQRHAER